MPSTSFSILSTPPRTPADRTMIWSVAHSARRGLRAGGGMLLAGVLVVLLVGLNTSPAWAQKILGRALESGTVLDLTETVPAVGISADETMLAAVEGGGPEGWRVSLIDRPSLGRLGYLTAGVGANPRLRFSPVGDLLLVAGDGALELWNLPIAALKPGAPLDEKHRVWRVAVKSGESLGQASFLAPEHDVIWSVGGQIFRKPARPGDGKTGDPESFWTSPDTTRRITGFSAAPTGRKLALTFAGAKTIALLEPGSPLPERELSGHRFEVKGTFFDGQGRLVSLDAGRNMIRYPAGERLGRTLFLKDLPDGLSHGQGQPMGPGHLLLSGSTGRGTLGRIVTVKGEMLAESLQANGPHALQASPTGRYLLTAEGNSVTVHRFAYPTSPLAYVRQLRGWKAYQTAQSYVRLMDDEGLSQKMKADLLAAVGQEPPGEELNKALKRLREAEQEGNAERIQRWADRVLAHAPDHPDGLAALRRLADLREAEILRQAREAYNLGQNRITITLLSSQIPEGSRRYPEALELIRMAEARRSVETLLVQAREKMSLGDSLAAEALLNEALRRAPDSEAALALQEQIDDRTGQGPWGFLAAGLGLILLTGGAGLAVVRTRRVKALRAAGKRDGMSEAAGRNGKQTAANVDKSGRRSAGGTGAGTGAGNAAGGTTGAGSTMGAGARKGSPAQDGIRGRSRTAGNGDAKSAASSPRRAVVEGLIRDIQNRIGAVRQADLHRKFTAALMEWEAELEAIVRNLGDPNAELGGLHRRLRSIAASLQGLKLGGFEGGNAKKEGPSGKGTAGGRKATGDGKASQPEEEAPRNAPENATYYELLQLGPEASQEEIKTSYHRLLKQYHPDLHHDSRFDWIKSESERMSRRISEAYQVLSDEGTRARYDSELRKSRKGGA